MVTTSCDSQRQPTNRRTPINHQSVAFTCEEQREKKSKTGTSRNCVKQEAPDVQGGVCDFYPFNDLISLSQTPLSRRGKGAETSQEFVPAPPPCLILPSPRPTRPLALPPHWPPQTCPTNMALFGIFFPPPAPVGRSLGAAGAGPRWRRRQRGFEIIAMATRVKTVLGRPGLGLHISSQLQVGPNTGLDVSHDSRGQTGHCCTFSTSQNYCSEAWSSVVAAINNQQVVSTLLSVEVFRK